jgi:hypothetical protein
MGAGPVLAKAIIKFCNARTLHLKNLQAIVQKLMLSGAIMKRISFSY